MEKKSEMQSVQNDPTPWDEWIGKTVNMRCIWAACFGTVKEITVYTEAENSYWISTVEGYAMLTTVEGFTIEEGTEPNVAPVAADV